METATGRTFTLNGAPSLRQTGRASGELCGNAVEVDLSGPIIPEG
ncbi:hypothetical protein [Candidatus Palauibacter sp.]